MTRLRLWSEKLIQTVVIKFAFTTMANVLRGAELWRTGKLFSKDRSLTPQQFETITFFFFFFFFFYIQYKILQNEATQGTTYELLY